MKRSAYVAALLLLVGAPLPLYADQAGPVALWMSDGQLRSNPVRIHLHYDLPVGVTPKLRLLAGHSILTTHSEESREHEPLDVIRSQSWSETAADGTAALRSGTVLLFDLGAFPIPWFKSVMRVTPLLSWDENGTRHSAIGSRPVNLGNSATAWITSGVFVGLILLTFAWMLGRSRFGRLLLAPDAHLSLSRFQIALWTVSVSIIVFGHGLIQLDVPAIPESIIALMGLSFATGGIANRPQTESPGGKPAPPILLAKGTWNFADLISDEGVPSISRAQMLLWTVIMVALFTIKSVLNGVVWEVPWSMVALMGLSQGSYLAPKFASVPAVPADAPLENP